MAKKTKSQLATDYFNLTGARAPKRWKIKELERHLDEAKTSEPKEPKTVTIAEVIEKTTEAYVADLPTVITVCCGQSRVKGHGETWSLSSGQWYCEAGKGCKVNAKPVEKNIFKAVAEKTTAKRKAKSAPKEKQPAIKIYYSVNDTREAIPGEKPLPRQCQVILDSIRRCAVEGWTSKEELVSELIANNGNSTEVAATYTHDLQCRQPALHVLMHYQRRLVDDNYIEMYKGRTNPQQG